MATIVLPRGNLTPTSASPLSTMTPSSSNQMSPPPLSSGIGGNLQRHDARPPLHVQPNCDTSPLMSSYSANPCMPLSAKPSPAGCCHTGAGSNHSLLGFGDNTSLAAGLSPMRSHVDMLGLVSPAPFGNASLKLHAMDAMPASISANSSNAGFGLALDNLIPIGQQPESPNMPPLPLAATLQFDYVGPSGRGSRRPSGGPRTGVTVRCCGSTRPPSATSPASSARRSSASARPPPSRSPLTARPAARSQRRTCRSHPARAPSSPATRARRAGWNTTSRSVS
jgi:hypothetical protein